MELIVALKQNSYTAFNQLYDLWHARTYYYFLKKCGSENAAQELTQQTFIKIWNYRQSLSLEHTFEAQLFQTAKHIFIDQLRKEARLNKIHDSLKREAGYTADDSPHHLELENKELLDKALQQLPPMRRQVFILHRLQGYSYKEIAAALSISVKTVDNHLSQAIKQLKELQLLTLILLICGKI